MSVRTGLVLMGLDQTAPSPIRSDSVMPKGVEPLIVGASSRAAAFTAMRDGLRPHCVDYFADRDLTALCPVDRVEPGDPPGGFLSAAELLPPSTWFYTGGLENQPDLVEQISRRHNLWGVGAEVLRTVRDPVTIVRVFDDAAIPSPRVRLDPIGLPTDGTWLVKPIASGGGRGIQPHTDRSDPGPSTNYYQQRIDGPSFSALFIGHRDGARLIGITRQSIGIAGAAFAYRGSLGPIAIQTSLTERLEAIGNQLVSACGMIGWFGVDYVLNQGIPWPVEINPRYTASVEIHELALGRSLMDEHRRACEGGEVRQAGPTLIVPRRTPLIAKRILYAPRRWIVPEIPDADEVADLFAVPPIADVPVSRTCIEPGEPVMTLFVTGLDSATCQSRLDRIEADWIRRLGSIERNRPEGDADALLD